MCVFIRVRTFHIRISIIAGNAHSEYEIVRQRTQVLRRESRAFAAHVKFEMPRTHTHPRTHRHEHTHSIVVKCRQKRALTTHTHTHILALRCASQQRAPVTTTFSHKTMFQCTRTVYVVYAIQHRTLLLSCRVCVRARAHTHTKHTHTQAQCAHNFCAQTKSHRDGGNYVGLAMYNMFTPALDGHCINSDICIMRIRFAFAYVS